MSLCCYLWLQVQPLVFQLVQMLLIPFWFSCAVYSNNLHLTFHLNLSQEFILKSVSIVYLIAVNNLKIIFISNQLFIHHHVTCLSFVLSLFHTICLFFSPCKYFLTFSVNILLECVTQRGHKHFKAVIQHFLII